MVFLILAALVVAAGSLRSLTFLPVVIVNTLIGIVQELRAKKELDKLTLLNAPRAMVVREGKVREVPAEELVQDDVVEFHAGDQICADAILLTGNCSTNEANCAPAVIWYPELAVRGWSMSERIPMPPV